MATEQVLTQRQISTLYRMVAQAFSEDLDEQLSIDINSLRSQLIMILKHMQLEEVMHTSNPQKHKGWKIVNLSPRKRALAMRGYILIFKFREYLLNESINYRYYFEDSTGQTRATEFTEANIAKYVKFSNIGIQINPSAAKYATAAQDYNDFMNYYFQLYTVPDKNIYMQTVSGGYGRVVRSAIMNQYFHRNPGLKTKQGRYQAFNRGHIYEAIDTALSESLSKDEAIMDNIIESYVFGKYLALDNVRASQGGDNPITNTSIKSGGADLYDFFTIKTQLEQILRLLDLGTIPKEEMIQIIQSNFLHKSKFATEQDFQNAAEKALNKLLNDLQQQLNK